MCKSDPAPAAADDESWLVYIDGQGVDVSAFSKRHPGGTKALRIYKNRDATEIFRQYHSDQAKDRLGAMVRAQQSGPTAPARSPRTAAMEDDLQALEDSARAAGAFRTSFTHEASKAFVVLGPIALGVYLMRTGTVAEAWCGVALLVFGQYQNGWVSHDWAHHGILESPWGNDIVATIGAAIQGYVTLSLLMLLLLLLLLLVRPRTTALATTAPAGTTARRPLLLLPLLPIHSLNSLNSLTKLGTICGGGKRGTILTISAPTR